MRKLSLFSSLLIVAVAMTNCAKETDTATNEPASKGGNAFEIVASVSSDTRTVNDGLNTKWASDDKVSVFHAPANGSYVSDGAFTIKNVETGLFDGTVSQSPVVGTQYDWIAVYPYVSQLVDVANVNGAYYYFGSRSDRTQTQSETNSMDHLCGSNLPMFGTVKAAEYTGEAPFIQMNQLSAVAAVNITNSTSAAINVASVEFTAPVDIVGAYYIHFSGETPTYTAYQNYQSSTAKLEVTNGTIAQGEVGKFYLAIKPFTATTGQKISVTVTTVAGESQTKEFDLTSSVSFNAGTIKNVKMKFTTEHVDQEYIQISSLSDITADGQYVFVLPDGKDPYYYAIQVSGTSGNLGEVTNKITKNTDGALVFNSPDEKFVWTVGTVSGNSFNFKNGNYCIWKPSSGTDINTKYSGSCYWTPALLESGCFSLMSGNRYLAEGSNTTLVKNYDHIVDQVAEGVGLPKQYAGAWAILKLGGGSTSTDPSIEPAVVSDLPARSANHTISVTKNNTQSALTIKEVDGVVVTNATVEGNTVTYTVSDNFGSESRNGSILVALADDESVTGLITVSQKAAVWTVSRTEVDVKAPVGSTAQVTVNSDFNWTIDASSLNGMTVEPMSFTYNGDPKQTLTITATVANGTSSAIDRGSFKIIRSDNAELGPVTVSQKDAKLATPVLTLTPDSANKSFTVSWIGVTNASKYEYFVLDESNGYKVPVTQTDDASTTSFVVSNVTLGKEYSVSVKAIGNNNPWIDSEAATETISVTATTVPVSFSAADFEGQGTSGTGSAISATKSDVTVSSDKGYCDGTAHVRVYSGGVITVSASSGTIAKIEFTSTSSGTSNNGPSKISLAAGENGSYSYSGYKGTWTGSAESVTFKANGQFRFTGIVVTFE